MPALDVGMPALDAGMPASDAGMPAQDVGCVLPPSRVRPPSQLPEQIGVVRAVATEHPDWLTHSCAERGATCGFSSRWCDDCGRAIPGGGSTAATARCAVTS